MNAAALADAVSDTPDPEALFDTIVAANSTSEPAAKAAAAVNGAASGPGADVLSRVGHMTRALHDSLRALGDDKLLESAACTIPDERARLKYLSTLTERAALRTLSATEAAKPIQARLAADAGALALRWDSVIAAQPGVEKFRALVAQTRVFLGEVPEHARATNALLTEVIVAHDFQDLTGQLIRKIAAVVQNLESQLVILLLEHAPADKRQAMDGLLNGPDINASSRADVVISQAQVDELLDCLGF